MSADLAAIEAALKAATPGPWQVHESIMADTFVYGPRGILRDDIIAGPTYNRENAHLIVLLRNSAAELVERVKVAEAAVVSAKADGWDERDRAQPQYLGPDHGHYKGCMGYEDCYCGTYPNPYRTMDSDCVTLDVTTQQHNINISRRQPGGL